MRKSTLAVFRALFLFVLGLASGSNLIAQDATVKELHDQIEHLETTVHELRMQVRELQGQQNPQLAKIEEVRGVVDPSTYEKLKVISSEAERVESLGLVDEAHAYHQTITKFISQTKGGVSNDAGDPELHHVGVYEGQVPDGKKRGFREHPEGVVEVKVDYVGGPIVLVLSSYEPVLWKLDVAKGAQIRRVLIGGYHKSRIEGLSDSIAIQREHKGNRISYLGYALDDSETPYSTTAATLRKITGLTPSTMVGGYGYRGEPFVIGPDNADWLQQLLSHRIDGVYQKATENERKKKRERYQVVRFEGMFDGDAAMDRRHYHREAEGGVWAVMTPSGPIASTLKGVAGGFSHIAKDPKSSTFYAIQGHDVVRVRTDASKKQVTEELSIPGELPELSWPCGITFDSKRRRVILVSLGGTGHMYSLDVDNDKWSLVQEMQNRDLASISYSKAEDAIYGLQRDHRGNTLVVKYSPKGGLLSEVSVDIPISRDRHGPAGSGRIHAAAGYVAVVSKEPIQEKGRDLLRGKCYLIDPANGTILFEDWTVPHAGRLNLSKDQLRQTWDELLEADDPELLIWRLAAGGNNTVQFISERLSEITPPDLKQVDVLIRQLEHREFRVRSRAAKKIQQIAGAADDHLREAKKQTDSVEVKMALARLLEESGKGEGMDPVAQREIHAVTALSRIEHPSASKLLKKIREEQVQSSRRAAARRLMEEDKEL